MLPETDRKKGYRTGPIVIEITTGPVVSVDLSELLAIVNIFVESPEIDKVVAALLKT